MSDRPSDKIIRIEQSLMTEAISKPAELLAVFRCAVMKYLDDQYEAERAK